MHGFFGMNTSLSISSVKPMTNWANSKGLFKKEIKKTKKFQSGGNACMNIEDNNGGVKSK